MDIGKLQKLTAALPSREEEHIEVLAK